MDRKQPEPVKSETQCNVRRGMPKFSRQVGVTHRIKAYNKDGSVHKEYPDMQ